MVLYATDNLKNQADAYALLSQGASEVWGLDVLPSMERAPNGKPFFPAFPACCFNLSHSGAFALCALDDAPVGADIQIVKDSWRDALPRRVCSPEELAWLEVQSDRWASFALLWTLKEARAKFAGTGLQTGVREISVPLPRGEQTLYRHDGLWFRIYAGNGWRAAVCGEHEPPEELFWVP